MIGADAVDTGSPVDPPGHSIHTSHRTYHTIRYITPVAERRTNVRYWDLLLTGMRETL